MNFVDALGVGVAIGWQVWATSMLFLFFEPLLSVAERAYVWAGVLGLRARVWLLRVCFGVGVFDVRGRYMCLVCAPGTAASEEYRDRLAAELMAQGALAVGVYASPEDMLRALNGTRGESDAALTSMGLQRITPAGATGCATTSPR